MDIDANIAEFNKEEMERLTAIAEGEGEPSADEQPESTDIFQEESNRQYENSKIKKPKGAPSRLNAVVKDLVEKAKPDFAKANDEIEQLKKRGEADKVKTVSNQYMQQTALPLVQSLVDEHGVEAVLNSDKALEQLDSIMITGNGTGKGYTQSYLKQMYKGNRGAENAQSDAEVTSAIRQITDMSNKNDIRSAVGLAQKMKQRIDNGELSATDDDYQTIQRVALYK